MMLLTFILVLVPFSHACTITSHQIDCYLKPSCFHCQAWISKFISSFNVLHHLLRWTVLFYSITSSNGVLLYSIKSSNGLYSCTPSPPLMDYSYTPSLPPMDYTPILHHLLRWTNPVLHHLLQWTTPILHHLP